MKRVLKIVSSFFVSYMFLSIGYADMVDIEAVADAVSIKV
jgi:hypothetical protein